MVRAAAMPQLTLREVDRNLQIPVLNICLAATAGKENDLREAKRMLVETVHDMLSTTAYQALNNLPQVSKEEGLKMRTGRPTPNTD